MKSGTIIYAIFGALLLFVIGNFVYNNVIVPWPHKEALQTCLSYARALEGEMEIQTAEDACFDTYPHFN